MEARVNDVMLWSLAEGKSRTAVQIESPAGPLHSVPVDGWEAPWCRRGFHSGPVLMAKGGVG